jgi:hypothetical protein
MRAPHLVALAGLAFAVGCADFDRFDEPSRCAGSSDRLCAGFDGAIDPPLVPHTDGEGSVVEIDDDLAFRGEGSLHVHAVHGAEERLAQVIDGNGTAGGPPLEWLRVFVRVADAAAYRSALVWVLIREAPFHGVLLSLGEGGRLAMFSWSADGNFDGVSAARLESQRWACLELGLAAGGGVEVWLDGAPVGGVTPPASAVAPGLSVLYLGAATAATDGAPVDAWFDELVLADQRVGCDR